MRFLIRGAEILQFVLLFFGLLAPLGLFFYRIQPAWGYLASRPIISALVHSLVLSITVAVLSTSLAFFFSWVLWRYQWADAVKRALRVLLRTPYLLPPFFFAMGWIALAAPHVGYLNSAALAVGAPELPRLYGLGGTILVLVLWSTALAMIQLELFFSQYPGHLEDAAILCGASPFRAFFMVTAGLARPQLFACALLVGVNAMAAFGVPAMIASPARTYVLTTRIFQEIKSSGSFSYAGSLSLLLLAITVALLIAQQIVQNRAPRFSLVGGKATRPAPLLAEGIWKFTPFFLGAFALLSCVLPIAALIAQAASANFGYVLKQIPDGWTALSNSFVTASSAAVLATLSGLLVAYGASRLKLRPSRFLSQALNIGYALPGTVIALSLLVFFSNTLADTLGIFILAYFIKYAAFALRILSPAISSLSAELEEAAWMSGASPLRAFFRIFAPILKPAIAAALFLAFVPMVSELTMSVLLVGAGTETLGSLIYRLQEYADPGSAAVLALAVATVTLVLSFSVVGKRRT